MTDVHLVDEWKNCGKCERCAPGGVKTAAQPHGPYWRALVYLGQNPPDKAALEAALEGRARSVYYRQRKGGYVTGVVYFGRELPPDAVELVRAAVERARQ